MKISGKVCSVPSSWKIDTGAKSTFLSVKSFNSIPYKNRPGLKPIKQIFATANGSVLHCEGEANVVLEFGCLEVYFSVIVGDVTQNLSGEDFINYFKCNFDHKERKFISHKGGKVLYQGFERPKSRRFVRVVSNSVTEIPSGCEVIVSAHFKEKPFESDGILVPDLNLSAKHGLLLARTLVSSGQLNVCARILNPTQ